MKTRMDVNILSRLLNGGNQLATGLDASSSCDPHKESFYVFVASTFPTGLSRHFQIKEKAMECRCK
ncbi:hypothetical protein OIU78_025104 [Salix suchowensis]|nr:hypothetical protein OIU78_025104 [Salix suchowensis]